MHKFQIRTAKEMLKFGAALAKAYQSIIAHEPVSAAMVIFLQGNLGAGKTTLVRGFLRALGYSATVKSPTFTLVESYVIPNLLMSHCNVQGESYIYHFDLYRLTDPEELDYIGIRDYFTKQAVCLIEWPEHGVSRIPVADLNINIDFVLDGRIITIQALSQYGELLVKFLQNAVLS